MLRNSKQVIVEIATVKDAQTIADILNEAADDLTLKYGNGHWSSQTTEKGVLYGLRSPTKILVARYNDTAVGTLCLGTRKPWVINISYFTPVTKTIYLTGMGVRPGYQGKGIGSRLIEEARKLVAEWPANSIRLDAYDAEAGAGDFYLKNGFEDRGHIFYKGIPHIYFEQLVASHP